MDYEFVPGRDDFPPDEIAMLRQQLASAQAKIDALMLEYCPNEMTKEQLDEWARNQRPVEEK